MNDVVTVRTDEPITIVIHRMSKLLTTRDQCDLVGLRIEPQIASSRRELPFWLSVFGRDRQISTSQARRKVDGVIATPFEPVGKSLNVRLTEASANDLFEIRDIVTIGVLHEVQMGWGENINTSLRTADRLSPTELICENDALVHRSIGVRIPEQPYATPAFSSLVSVFLDSLFWQKRIVRHFDNVHPVPLIKRCIDRIGNEWFAGNQFE